MYLVSRTETFAKLFFLLSFSGLIMYIVLAFYTFHTALLSISKAERAKEALKRFEPDTRERYSKDLKYILLWTIPELNYNFTTQGQQVFISNDCSHLNCYLTTNKDLLNEDVRNFNAIVFSINTLRNWKHNMPSKRSSKQKYVFYSMTSADELPVCNVKADSFFNWTWSYKLYSDIFTPFIEVRDMNNKVVAPKNAINWAATMEVMENTLEMTTDLNLDSNNYIKRVGNKTKALMWIIDKCDSDGRGSAALSFALQLKNALKERDLIFDIYGCGFKKCPIEGCFTVLKRDYYYYLAHEDSISEDYVTTEVLKAYHNYAVPIVVGGADYVKFLPMYSYIDTAHESIEGLAAFIQYSIKSPSVYKNYFAWKKLFTIHATNFQDGYCELCAMLNDKKKMGISTVYENFRKWWFYGSLKDRCYPKGAERYDDVLSYVKN